MISDFEYIVIEQELSDLEIFFDNTKLPSEPVRLDPCCRVTDIPLFIKTHMSISKHQIKNSRYKPYFQRLIQFRNSINLRTYNNDYQ